MFLKKWLYVGAIYTVGVHMACVGMPDLSVGEARELFKQAPVTATTTPYTPNQHPGAQWFADAGFGLFIHWGIYSCREEKPSWGMLHNRFAPKFPRDIEVDDYYALADEFNPQRYDPDEWMAMAKAMGMTYAVITTKHHDGYCLWPSEFGDYSTRNGADGRDLVKEYIEAARRHGLKVGLYYSPRDWGYNNHINGFPVAAQKFDSDNPKTLPFPEEENLKRYQAWVEFAVGQMSELLTQYGSIDVLWFDGAHWLGDVPGNETGAKVRNWIYSLQPQIVINPRWGSVINPDYSEHASAGVKKIERSAGDFYTFEAVWKHIIDPSHNAGVKEPIWFEFCDLWKGSHWGYMKEASGQPDQNRMRRTLERLSILRAFGGNYLLNISPGPDGQIRTDIMAESAQLAPWIQARKEAFFGVEPVKNWEELCDVPLTRNGNTVYLHLTGETHGRSSTVCLNTAEVPSSACLMGDASEDVEFMNTPAGIEFSVPVDGRDRLGDVLRVEFEKDLLSRDEEWLLFKAADNAVAAGAGTHQ